MDIPVNLEHRQLRLSLTKHSSALHQYEELTPDDVAYAFTNMQQQEGAIERALEEVRIARKTIECTLRAVRKRLMSGFFYCRKQLPPAAREVVRPLSVACLNDRIDEWKHDVRMSLEKTGLAAKEKMFISELARLHAQLEEAYGFLHNPGYCPELN